MDKTRGLKSILDENPFIILALILVILLIFNSYSTNLFIRDLQPVNWIILYNTTDCEKASIVVDLWSDAIVKTNIGNFMMLRVSLDSRGNTSDGIIVTLHDVFAPSMSKGKGIFIQDKSITLKTHNDTEVIIFGSPYENLQEHYTLAFSLQVDESKSLESLCIRAKEGFYSITDLNTSLSYALYGLNPIVVTSYEIYMGRFSAFSYEQGNVRKLFVTLELVPEHIFLGFNSAIISGFILLLSIISMIFVNYISLNPLPGEVIRVLGMLVLCVSLITLPFLFILHPIPIPLLVEIGLFAIHILLCIFLMKILLPWPMYHMLKKNLHPLVRCLTGHLLFLSLYVSSIIIRKIMIAPTIQYLLPLSGHLFSSLTLSPLPGFPWYVAYSFILMYLIFAILASIGFSKIHHQ